jgi:excisionase family DNA binding protein
MPSPGPRGPIGGGVVVGEAVGTGSGAVWYPRWDQRTAWRLGALTPTLPSAAGRSPPVTSGQARIGLKTQNEADRPMASMAINELGPMLTASEVADMLHLHVNTVKRLGDRGELPFYRVCKRGDRRFRYEDVMDFLARNR